jgi:predicted enzyme related to lactoylglutathione lyase
MSNGLPAVPAGNGQNPVTLVAIAARRMTESCAFYERVFGWQTYPLSPVVTAAVPPAGPSIALRSDAPDGFQAAVPFISVVDVDAALRDVVAAGCTVERATWTVPNVGRLARFADSSGTVYGLSESQPSGPVAPMPMPMGANPRPPAGAICSLEMYAADGLTAAQFFGAHFGWGSVATMPRYVAFDPGASVGGVFQSHTAATPAVAYVYTYDARITLALIEEAGGTAQGQPMSMPGMATFGYFTDPSGTQMGLIAP